MKRFKLWQLVGGMLCLLLGMSFLSSCSEDDDNLGPEKENTDNGEVDADEEPSVVPSNYKPEDFFGVWREFETDPNGNDEWQKVFYTDEWENGIGEGRDRRYSHRDGGFVWFSDFKWWLGEGDEIHFLEYDTGNEFVARAIFYDGNPESLCLMYDGYEKTYFKVD